MNTKLIGDLVEVPPVRTVIRLKEGHSNSPEITGSFVFTPEVASHFTVIAEALKKEKGQGYFLQGDFGSGKSHFLAALYAWLASGEGSDKLEARHEGLGSFGKEQARFLPVAVSLLDYRASTPLERIIADAVKAALSSRDSEAGSLAPDEKEKRDILTDLLAHVREAGFSGLFVLIDELSEFFRSKPSPQGLNEDARTLQLIGELALEWPLWIVAAVQESIESTGDISLAIFRKIRDRFPVKLILSTRHIRSLISGRLVRRKPGADDEIYRIYQIYRQRFDSFDWPFDEFQKTYPVHPATISLLDGLGELFSEHRGIVDFVHSRLAGDEQRNIRGILGRPAAELLAPDSIYDHFAGRLAEFSSFHIYPRHIVPHLDDVIVKVLDEDDWPLARRLIRTIVLYGIHPTADTPPVQEIAEMTACSLDLDSPEQNVRYISEVILDPMVDASRFLVKRKTGADGKPIYCVVTEDDPGKTLEARIRKAAEDLDPDDSRLLSHPLKELPQSESWPGPQVMGSGARRIVSWCFSTRRAIVHLFDPGGEKVLEKSLRADLSAGEIDFAVVMAIGETDFSMDHTAVWRISALKEGRSILKEALAAEIVAGSLSSSNPADAALIQIAADRVARLKPVAQQKALDAIYAGSFSEGQIHIEPAVRQLRHFDRLLDAAGEVLLAQRYSSFRQVAPRRISPSARLYQQLLDDFIAVGSMYLREAHEKRLSNAIDGLAVPLGLVEQRGSSYVFSPDISGHPLLSFLFSLLRPSGPTPLADVLNEIRTGAFGLPAETASFLISALAVGGLVTLLRGGKALPVEYLNIVAIGKAEEIAPGELIGDSDRRILKTECSFLINGPAGRDAEPLDSFGLRQQRDAWKNTVKFRDTSLVTISELRSQLSRMADFSIFKNFDLEKIESKLESFNYLTNEIKVSYSAKNGLERFLAAWRSTGLNEDDINLIGKLNRFLKRKVEELVYINHYILHPAVIAAARQDRTLDQKRDQIISLLEQPELSVIVDNGQRLDNEFVLFRDSYTSFYSGRHGEYYQSFQKPQLSKMEARAAAVLGLLSSVEALDRPEGLEALLQEIFSAKRECRRRVTEELLRSPVCGCGFLPGNRPEEGGLRDNAVGQALDNYLLSYAEILKDPKILEALVARSYAIQDIDPDTAADLKRLGKTIGSSGLKPAALISLISEGMARELAEALSGRIQVHHRSLSILTGKLQGRRLRPGDIRTTVETWLGSTNNEDLISIDGKPSPESPVSSPISGIPAASEGGSSPVDSDCSDWWLFMREDLLDTDLFGMEERKTRIRTLAGELERRHPSSEIKKLFHSEDILGLYTFISGERFHTCAIKEALRTLAERILNGDQWIMAEERPEILSRHIDPDLAAAIGSYLLRIRVLAEARDLLYPGRLSFRLLASGLRSDPWTTEELKLVVDSAIEQEERMGETWLNGLPPVETVSLEENPVVLIIDAVPPDVWLGIADTVEREVAEALSVSWSRLEAEPETRESIAALFDFKGDPTEEFAVRDIPYHNLSGYEEQLLADLIMPIEEEKPAVIRLSVMDKGAHSGTMNLPGMTEALSNILGKNLPRLLELCRLKRRPLILTTDHGLSLKRGELLHGRGGVYERAIFRARWES